MHTKHTMHRQCFNVSAGRASFLENHVKDIVSTLGALFSMDIGPTLCEMPTREGINFL